MFGLWLTVAARPSLHEESITEFNSQATRPQKTEPRPEQNMTRANRKPKSPKTTCVLPRTFPIA
jgi:hypothetical protein